MRNLALTAINKEHGPPDYASAVDYLHKADEAGDFVAPGLLGWMYLNGKGVQKDAAKGVELLRRGMERDDQAALFRYASCLKDGVGVEKNLEEALRCAKSLQGRETPHHIQGSLNAEALVKEIEAAIAGKPVGKEASDRTAQRVGTKRTNHAANEANTIIKRLVIALALALTLGPIGLIYVSWKRSIAVAAILWALWWWQPQLWLLWWSGLSIAAVVLFGVGRSRSVEDDLGFRSKTYQRQQRRNG